MLFIFYFLKHVTASIGCYILVYTRSRLLKLGSNFREICLARRVSTARSHPYPQLQVLLGCGTASKGTSHLPRFGVSAVCSAVVCESKTRMSLSKVKMKLKLFPF